MTEEELVALRTCTLGIDKAVKIDADVKILMEKHCDDLFPVKNYPTDAGFDIFAAEEIVLEYNETKKVSVGFKMALPEGFEAQIRSRSGNSGKLGLVVKNSPGTIDESYRGIVCVLLHYTGIQKIGEIEPRMIQQHGAGVMSFQNGYKLTTPKQIVVKRGDKIAQMVIKQVPCVRLNKVSSLDETARGSNGFGSSGLAGA